VLRRATRHICPVQSHAQRDTPPTVDVASSSLVIRSEFRRNEVPTEDEKNQVTVE